MIDVAASPDERGIAIEQVGVTDVHIPIRIRRKGGGHDTVVARVSLAADLSQVLRGTHMSRFVALLNSWRERPISYDEVEAILADTRKMLHGDVAHIELAFKYFMTKQAPSSGIESLMDYDVRFRGRLDEQRFRFILSVNVPVTALCPCSKEISKYGAHNQRAVISCSVELHPGHILWIEDLVQLLEQQGSAELFPLLKREDEKYVTEYAYDHPKFVEDILRDSITALRAEPRAHGFSVRVDSLESIHNHNVYAAHNEGLRHW
ncbi:MAG TPA: GTP cyclohydrolase FolE2 [Armatimonadota bacterium]|jgi:GTP cyclohydrolase I